MSTIPLRFLLGSLAVLAACSDGTAPPKPTGLALANQPPASLQVGSGLAVTVIVKDQNGNAMSGQPLSVIVSGGGSISGVPASTQGPTTLGGWRLGTKVGTNTMIVTSGSLPPLTVSVQGTAGAATAFSATLPTTVTVGQTIPLSIAAVDTYQNPVPATGLTLIATGGGSIAPSSVTTDATGSVLVQWSLGTIATSNSLQVVSGTATSTLTITPKPDVPSVIQILQGDNQTADAGSTLPLLLQVKATDRFGNATPQQSVVFSVANGGGTLAAAASSQTDPSGLALSPAWTLGKRNIPQQLIVSVGSVSRVATAAVRTSYKITLRYIGSPTDAQKAIFEGAASRVSAAINAGASPVSANGFSLSSSCGLTGFPPLTEVIDGIVIYAGITPIDGPGKILAQSGPCGFRSGALNFLPAIAIIQFDEADLASLANGGSLEDVATHEMFHSLGYGTLWTTFGYVSGSVLVDPRYLGLFGNVACAKVAAPPVCGTFVPLENTGGSGTAGGHWRETTFGHELMTGYLNGGTNPLSVMSIEAMKDLGYSVSSTAADAYSQAAALRASPVVMTPDVPWERVFSAVTTQLEPAGGLMIHRRTP